GLTNTAHDVLGVAGGPDAVGAVQGQIEGVLADYPDGRHGDLDAAAPRMGVHDDQIGRDLVPSDDIPLGHAGQHPDLAAHLQRACRLIGDTLAQELVGKLKSILILDNLVAVRDNAQHAAISIADVGLVARDPAASVGVDIP